MSSLYSPILAQAGFAKRKLASVIEWVAETDGATQYWQLSEPINIPADVDFDIKFTLLGRNSSYEGLLDSPDGSFWLRFLGSAQSNNLQGQIEGSYISSVLYSDINLRDGSYHTLSIKRINEVVFVTYDGTELEERVITSGFSIDKIAKYSTVEFGGIVKDFEVSIDGNVTNKIPLTNKAQGATQLATVGNINAFMPNYTDAVWKNKAELV